MADTHMIENEPDFDVQMKSLAVEAQQHLDDRTGQRSQPNIAEVLKPIVVGIEMLGRAMTGNTLALERLQEQAAVQHSLPALMESVQETIKQKNRLNQLLFDSLHEELRTYKDELLLEILHRPIACDLITLFDDLSALHRHTEKFLEQQSEENSPSHTQMKIFSTNVEHIVHAVIEILARIEVERVEALAGKLDKQKQRAVSVQLAETPEEDQQIVTSVKPGFVWRERLLRPEEVTIKKWKEGMLVTLPITQK